jgi:hypothetical protein
MSEMSPAVAEYPRRSILPGMRLCVLRFHIFLHRRRGLHAGPMLVPTRIAAVCDNSDPASSRPEAKCADRRAAAIRSDRQKNGTANHAENAKGAVPYKPRTMRLISSRGLPKLGGRQRCKPVALR